MQFSREKLDEIKSRIDVYDWYHQYLPDLKVTGSNRAFTPCPFHLETKPSFCVDLKYGLWRCFGGCNTGGDIFAFYQKMFNVSFTEAVETIAKQVGVILEVDPEVQKEIEERNKNIKTNDIICSKFQSKLELQSSLDAWNYLTIQRGFSPKIIEHFRLGVGIKNLHNLLVNDKQRERLHNIGLLKRKDNGEYYPTFADYRVTIPRIDERGNVLSFSGRTFIDKDNVPKYLHTVNTDIYDKSAFIYGLYQAKKYIKHFNSAILVEGELDCIKCHQKGIVNAVSISGLNISDTQVNMLKKYTNTFYICLEDQAPLNEISVVEDGKTKRKTSLDKIYEKIKANIPYAKVYIVDLRQADGSKCDPDMYLEQHSKEEFKELIKHAQIYNEFIINQKLKGMNPKNLEEKAMCLNILMPTIEQIDNFMTRKMYIELIANKLLVSENDIYKKLKYRTQQKEKAQLEDVTYDKRPVFAQKVLLSICFAPNFNNIEATLMVGVNTKDKMEPFYRNIFNDYILPYVAQYKKNHGDDNCTSVDFSDLFSSINHDENISSQIKSTILDAYMKTEMFEDFDNGDLYDLIEEQLDTLKEYVYTEVQDLSALSA